MPWRVELIAVATPMPHTVLTAMILIRSPVFNQDTQRSAPRARSDRALRSDRIEENDIEHTHAASKVRRAGNPWWYSDYGTCLVGRVTVSSVFNARCSRGAGVPRVMPIDSSASGLCETPSSHHTWYWTSVQYSCPDGVRTIS
jgi:hypothetical protein